jgi:hypothetical protein
MNKNVEDEVLFLERAIESLELVKMAQESQKEDGWSRFTGEVITNLKDRAERQKNCKRVV